MKLTRVNNKIPLEIYRLKVHAEIKFCVLPEYEITIAVPSDYIILQNSDVIVTSSKDLKYKEVTQKISKKKYRNLSGNVDLFLYSEKAEVAEKHIKVLIKKKTGTMLTDKKFSLTVSKGAIALKKMGKLLIDS